jgi:hypothetical protein
MPWLRHLAVLFAFLAAFVRPAPASAFTPATSEIRVGGFEVAAQLLACELAAASLEQHQGIGAAYDENASGYRFAARSGQRLLGPARNFAEGQLEKHFAKHAGEWGAGNITQTGYLKRAQDLLSREVGGDILGATRPGGDILRYNVRTNEFAVGTAEGTIRTLFRPQEGMAYWLRQVP